MHFIVALTVGFDFENHWRKNGRYSSGGQNNLMDQLQRARLTSARDKADVPNYRPLSIDIGVSSAQNLACGISGIWPVLPNFSGKRLRTGTVAQLLSIHTIEMNIKGIAGSLGFMISLTFYRAFPAPCDGHQNFQLP